MVVAFPKQFFSCARQPTELRGGFTRNRDGNKEIRCCAVAIEAGIYDGGERLAVQANQQGSAAFPSAKGRHCRPAVFQNCPSCNRLVCRPPHGFTVPCSDVTTSKKRCCLKKACSPGHPIAVMQFLRLLNRSPLTRFLPSWLLPRPLIRWSSQSPRVEVLLRVASSEQPFGNLKTQSKKSKKSTQPINNAAISRVFLHLDFATKMKHSDQNASWRRSCASRDT